MMEPQRIDRDWRTWEITLFISTTLNNE